MTFPIFSTEAVQFCRLRAAKDFKEVETVRRAMAPHVISGIDALVVVGGDSSFRGARDLSVEGMPTIGIPEQSITI